jgi:glutathione peroxidase
MKMLIAGIIIVAVFITFAALKFSSSTAAPKGEIMETGKTIYDFTVNDIDGNPKSLADYKGKVVVIVNVASKCGLTPQYKDIEAFYQQWKDKGVVVLGFPANNFMGQEPGTAEQIKTFCSLNYGVTFPMFEKISVKGNDKHPLYQYLTKKDQNGWFEEEVSWNFQKFLINKEGKMIKSFSPRTSVTDKDFITAIQENI